MDGETSNADTIKSGLGIFDDQPLQITQLKGQWLEIEPDNQYVGTDGTTIMIKIPQASGWYFDFNDAYMIIECSIVKATGANLDANDNVAFINFAAAALFKDIKLVGGGQKIEGDNGTYAYKAYLYTLLTAGISPKQYQLAVSAWVKDDATKFDDASNAGFITRQAWTAMSKTCQFAI